MNNIIFKTLLLKGEAGNDIQSVEKTATSGLVDTYTITLTDGSTHTFNVTNGKSIVSIEKTSSVGYVDTYTITYNDGSTDTFEITLATITVDNALSDSSTNPVQNKLITQNLNHLTNNTCVNLLNPTAQTQTINGVTFTNNGDGTYTVNGTATAQAYILATSSPVDLIPFRNKDIRIAGCPTGGGANKYQFNLNISDASDGDIARVIDYGGGSTYHVPSNAHHAYIVLVVQNGYTANNLLFKPMITTDLNAKYDDYVPYTGVSGRLNKEMARLIPVQEQIVPSANIESGTTASQAYTVGAYLVFNGKLCKVISAIAQGDTLTVGTNIEVTTSGGELTRLNSDLTVKATGYTWNSPNVFYSTSEDATSTMRIRRTGNIIYAHFNLITKQAVSANTEYTIATVTDTAFIPTYRAVFKVGVFSGTSFNGDAKIYFNTDGTIKILFGSAQSSNEKYIQCDLVTLKE